MIGYHLTEIKKGKLGEWSKVEEEWAEFRDAQQQGSKIMMMVELSDVYGAIRAFYYKYGNYGDAIVATGQEMDKLRERCQELGIDMDEVKIFSDITKRAFESGERK